MDITCPHCRQTLEGDPSLAGETVTCPGCNRVFSVPKLLVVTPSPTEIPRVRSAKKSGAGKWIAIGIPLAVLLLFGGILGHNLLRESVGQHPEDGDSQIVLEMEEKLIMDYCEVVGEDQTEDFLRTVWTEERSDQERHDMVPWSCLELSAKARQMLRAEQLMDRFWQAAREYDRKQEQKRMYNRSLGIKEKRPGVDLADSILNGEARGGYSTEQSSTVPVAPSPFSWNGESSNPNSTGSYHWDGGRAVWSD